MADDSKPNGLLSSMLHLLLLTWSLCLRFPYSFHKSFFRVELCQLCQIGSRFLSMHTCYETPGAGISV